MYLFRSTMKCVLTVAALLLTFPGISFAAEGGIDKADTVFIIVATAMVLVMIPGLALFYGGLARRKNVLGTMMHSFFLLALISIQWVLIGYTLSFGDDVGGIVGAPWNAFLMGVGLEPNGNIPHLLFMAFQGMFAAITVALITGGFAERVRFAPVIIFSLLWATFIYDPLCHWVWGGGWLAELGVLDFAGGLVVHLSCGVSALVVALYVGKRRGFPRSQMPPHSLPLTLVGIGLLWFGWFGFNAGSALEAGGTAVLALVTTNIGASMGVITWSAIEWIRSGKPTLLGAVSGAVAGLGSITPAAGFVSPTAAIAIGFVGAVLCYFVVSILKPRLQFDDSLDVFGIHGIGGAWGILSIGIFASFGASGLLSGGGVTLLLKQAIGVIATVIFTGVGTLIIVFIVDKITSFRVSVEEELEGLDYSQHGESGYHM